MNNIRVNGKNISGIIGAIPSKSFAHRAFIAAALADGVSEIYFDKSSDDMDYTLKCLEALGAKIEYIKDKGVRIHSIQKLTEIPFLDVGESGSTFRFLLPVATTLYNKVSFIGRGRLPDRPIKDLTDVLTEFGVKFDNEKLPFTSEGQLQAGKYYLPGDVSSQYVSGLLFAVPLLEGKSEIILKSALESIDYVNMTVAVLKEFGVKIEEEKQKYKVAGQKYISKNYQVEGDWSNAAFFLVAGAIGTEITMTGLNNLSIQGDSKIIQILKEFGADVEVSETEIKVKKNQLKPINVDLKDIPDSLPILAIAAAAVPEGVSRFYNGKRLRLKESDRLRSVAQMIIDLGGKVEEKEEELLVYGTNGLKGGKTSSHGDHRLAMASSIASMISEEAVIIENPEAVSKSYPLFFEDFKKLGGTVNEC